MDSLSQYRIGEPVVIELDCETLVGNLKAISPDGRKVELTNVRDLDSGFVFTSPQDLLMPSIKSIRRLRESNGHRPLESHIVQTPEEEAAAAAGSNENLVPITSNEIDHIQFVVSSATLITQTDQKYHKALADIKHQSIIALHVVPTEFGRHNRASLMAIATSHQVYIFDLMSLGKIFKELKLILEADCPKKIVYYSNKVADNLKYQHGLELRGIFDNFVAHCLVSKQKAPISLVQCVNKYFNIPERFFEGEDQLQAQIYTRPLSHLKLVAKKAIFLYKLHEHLLHKIMLKNFYKQCQDFSVVFAENSDSVEVALQMKPNAVHGSDSIGDESWNELMEKKFDGNSSFDEDN